MKNLNNPRLTDKKDLSRRRFIAKTTMAAIGTLGVEKVIASGKDSGREIMEEKLAILNGAS